MLIFAAAVIAAVPAATTDPKVQPVLAPVCQQTRTQRADQTREPSLLWGHGPESHDLAEEPAANLYSAVLYSEGQCTKPRVISRNIGNLSGKHEQPNPRFKL